MVLIVQMYPDRGNRGPYRDPIPDCSQNGHHRLGQAHFLPTDRSVILQVCRRCGERKYTKIVITNGRIMEKSIGDASIISTPLEINTNPDA